MAIKEALLPEFDHEMGTTRKLLERVPDQKFDWGPHQKSMSLGRLASHIAEIPSFVNAIIGSSSFNMSSETYKPWTASTRADIVAAFDKNVADARTMIAGKSDAEYMMPWTFQMDGKDMFTLPKVGVVRSFLLNHIIHHRGQLSVYLRLNDVPVPSIYGPSADEG